MKVETNSSLIHMSHSGTLSQSQMHYYVLQFFLLIHHHITSHSLISNPPCCVAHLTVHSIVLPPSSGRFTHVTKQALNLREKDEYTALHFGICRLFWQGLTRKYWEVQTNFSAMQCM